MTPRQSDSRERMVRSAIRLLRRHGAGATTIDRVLADSGAPRGSVYHHFPGGRNQLIDEAVTRAGASMHDIIDATQRAPDPVVAVDDFFALFRQRLVDGAFRSGCPIVAAAVAANDDAPELTQRAGAVFEDWQDRFTALFRRHGLPEDRSRRLAALVIAAWEGAVLLCRAQQAAAPMDAVSAEIHELLVHAFAGAAVPADD